MLVLSDDNLRGPVKAPCAGSQETKGDAVNSQLGFVRRNLQVMSMGQHGQMIMTGRSGVCGKL